MVQMREMMRDLELTQSWPMPSEPVPIALIGAGGIVRDAHLPAYRKAGFPVCGVFDIDHRRARSLANDWSIDCVFDSLDQATAQHGNSIIYDLATPPAVIGEILEQLPVESTVLIQKPMGNNLEQARQIRQISRDRKLKSAVNFQLRFSPMMMAAREIVAAGFLGELLEINVEVNIFTPWHLFPFLKGMERVEISVHSIHYLDMIRALAGNPQEVFCRTLGDPRSTEVAQTRTSAILDYGRDLRAIMNINHNHRCGNKHQMARFRLEGTQASMFIKLGVLYDYPKGEADEVWYCRNGGEWQSLGLCGTWFPDAFVGKMANVQRFHCAEDDILVSDTEDACQTMALVEACYEANELRGVAPKLD